MKRFNVVLLACLVILSLTGCSFKWNFDMLGDWFFVRNDKTNSVSTSKGDAIKELNDSINTPQDDGNEFVFTIPDVDYVVEDTGLTTDYRRVNLYLDEGVYYPVRVPADTGYVTDNSKHIYAKDCSFAITVVSNIDLDSLAEVSRIKNPVELSKALVVTPDGVKGSQEAILHIINDKAIIVRTYDNPVAYRTILLGLEEEMFYTCEIKEARVVDTKTEVLKKLPLYTGHHMTVAGDVGDEMSRIYMYDDGSITLSKELRNFETAKKTLSTKTAAVSGTDIISKVYESKKVYYAELGEYTLGIYNVNFNTVYTSFGFGEEARFNVVKFLEYQLQKDGIDSDTGLIPDNIEPCTDDPEPVEVEKENTESNSDSIISW